MLSFIQEKFQKRVMQWCSMAELRFNREFPIITVFARIEGEKTRRIKVALDTGATFVMIPWEVAEILGYNPGASPKKRKIITASGIQHVPLVVLISMSVLEMEAHNVEALVHNLPKESNVDGLLGLTFLRNFKICLDFRKGVLSIKS